MQTVSYTLKAQALFTAMQSANESQGTAYREFKAQFPQLGESQAKALTEEFKVQCLLNTGFSPMAQSQVKKALAKGERISTEQMAVNALFKSFQNTKSLLAQATKAGISYAFLSKSALETALKAIKPESETPELTEEKAVKAVFKLLQACDKAGLDFEDIVMQAQAQANELAKAQALIDEKRASAEPAYSAEVQTALFMGK